MLSNNRCMLIALLTVAPLTVQFALPIFANNLTVNQKGSRHKKLTESQALTLIDARPEVKKWRSEVEQAAKTRKVSAHVALDRKEGHDYVVHVYEDVDDDSDDSHSATFGWFYVNDSTGKVRKEI